ncbi:uncharacterized protein BDR25DRAFT_386823 [Lindgomyces ingoldianus]|uniref:Uncharacterized protein n=1 Tax=Lindgomyces ingoldianus TaxID=673940 RepID=A0ACB6R3K6_9PLEO|nr:uncharacterized protein BDR25DRAFT_386823 [Lindgomyces ingoldianus]KAF2473899.1 hypothetical protein BDR25DRAFT_386823 [Lindgomyces ingoldianus]
MIASFGCMAAVVTILARMQSQPLSHWTFLISLNATIATFITAAKSMALLVLAACIAQSKWILFKSSARKLRELDLFEDASRGPLGSLMLLLHVRWRLGIASIGAIATVLALGVDTFAQQVVGFDTREVEIYDRGASFGLSRIYNGSSEGIFNITATPFFKCHSKCVWKESYVSLGFVSNCADVTVATLASNITRNDAQYYDHDNWMTTPGNISIYAHFSQTSEATKVNVVAVSLVPNAAGGQPFAPEFVRIAVVRSSESYMGEPQVFRDTLEVVECTVSLTAYTYSDMSASGNQLNIKSNPTPLQPAPSFRMLVFNQTGLPILQSTSADIIALVQLFTSPRFSGEIREGETSTTPPQGIGLSLRNGDISKAFENMAHSMTEQLRSSNDVAAYGLTVTSIVFVRVRWAWLAFPFGILAASALLLFATVINNCNHKCHLWKSSMVAILYHQVVIQEDAKGVLHTDMQSLEQLKALANGTKARLE